MLKQARLIHYDPAKGFGFLQCLGYSGSTPSLAKDIYFHASALAVPSIEFRTGTIRFRYPRNLVPFVNRPGVLLAYKPDSQNQSRAYTVCSPKSYLHNYAHLYTYSTPCAHRIRFFLRSWLCAELCRHPKPAVAASLQYVYTRLRTLEGSSLEGACATRLAQAIVLFHETLCALRKQDPHAATCLELLRFGLLRYDELLPPAEAQTAIEALLSQLPESYLPFWVHLASALTPQSSLS